MNPLANLIDPNFLFFLPGLLLGLTVHEFAHAWVALRYGDPTALRNGRVTLNPLAHIDPWGLICLVFFRFGWGKPVPVYAGNFRKPIEAQIAVSLAGVVANVFLIVVASILYGILLLVAPFVAANNLVWMIYRGIIIYNASMAVFNLIPIPPLDGSKVLMLLLPYDLARIYAQLSQTMGMMLVMMLSWSGLLTGIMRPAVTFLQNLAIRIAQFIALLR